MEPDGPPKSVRDDDALRPITGPSAELEAGEILADGEVAGRVVRGGALRTGSFLAANLLAAAGAVVVLRYLGVDEFGRYATVISLVAIVQGFTDAGLTVTGTREMSLAPGPDDRRELLRHILAIRLVLTGAGVLFAVAFAAIAGFGAQLVAGTAVAGAGILIASVASALLLPLAVELRNGVIAAAEVVRQGSMVLAWLVAAVAGASLIWFFAAQVVAGLALLALVPIVLRGQVSYRPAWSADRIRALVAVGLPIAVGAALTIMYFKVLVILMSLLGSEEDTGLYATAARIFELVAGLPGVLAIVALPVLTVAATSNKDRLDYVMQMMTEVAFLGGVLIALVLAIAAEPILLVLGGEQYVGAAPVLRIQCVAIVSLFVASALSPSVVAMGRQQQGAAAVGLGVLVVLGLGLVLIPAWGPEGAAVALVVADLVLLSCIYLIVRAAGPGRRLRFGFVPKVVFAALVAAAPSFIIGAAPAVCAAVAVVIFGTLAVLLGLIPPEVRHLWRSRPD